MNCLHCGKNVIPSNNSGEWTCWEDRGGCGSWTYYSSVDNDRERFIYYSWKYRTARDVPRGLLLIMNGEE